MSLMRKSAALRRSIYFRLAIMYAAICTASLAAIFMAAYFILANSQQKSLDSDLAGEIEEYAALLRSQDLSVLRDVLDHEAFSEGTDRIFFRVIAPNGDLVYQTDMRAWEAIPASPSSLQAAAAGQILLESFPDPVRGAPIRMIYGALAPGLILQIGESTLSDIQTLHRFRQVFSIGILGFVGCSLFMGVVMARRALSGVRRVTFAVRTISGGGWDSRVPISRRGDEIDELAMAFNEMIDRIQILIRELKEVTDDIAHDLRTPITRMRIMAESTLSRPPEKEISQTMAGQVIEECDRLLELINTMLEISQIRANTKPLARRYVDISTLVEDICDLFQSAAEDKAIRLDFESEGECAVEGEERKLKRAIAHIIDNAVKYTPPEGRIRVRCRRQGAVLQITVCDTGIGIPAQDLEKIFARFYRVDKSRSETGNGLGLSLSRAIFRAHGGDVRVISQPGEGSTFTATISAQSMHEYPARSS